MLLSTVVHNALNGALSAKDGGDGLYSFERATAAIVKQLDDLADSVFTSRGRQLRGQGTVDFRFGLPVNNVNGRVRCIEEALMPHLLCLPIDKGGVHGGVSLLGLCSTSNPTLDTRISGRRLVSLNKYLANPNYTKLAVASGISTKAPLSPKAKRVLAGVLEVGTSNFIAAGSPASAAASALARDVVLGFQKRAGIQLHALGNADTWLKDGKVMRAMLSADESDNYWRDLANYVPKDLSLSITPFFAQGGGNTEGCGIICRRGWYNINQDGTVGTNDLLAMQGLFTRDYKVVTADFNSLIYGEWARPSAAPGSGGAILDDMIMGDLLLSLHAAEVVGSGQGSQRVKKDAETIRALTGVGPDRFTPQPLFADGEGRRYSLPTVIYRAFLEYAVDVEEYLQRTEAGKGGGTGYNRDVSALIAAEAGPLTDVASVQSLSIGRMAGTSSTSEA